ncbi:MAG: hypothetical protein IKI12_08120 [Lachnospiraceae bacterium]|nr:hypothetical protein [Lachnospiraceae bacterium]
MEYTESYYCLCHGTDEQSANNIISKGFLLQGNMTSWCGRGVYFYDIKAKAWWAANRKCNEIRKKEHRDVEPTVIFADIENLSKEYIFDLRVKKDLELFEEFVNKLLNTPGQIDIPDISDDVERKIVLRAMLISFYADSIQSKLVIGNFRQRPQPLYEHAIMFADSLDMIFGIETIYCVKDVSIINNIQYSKRR